MYNASIGAEKKWQVIDITDAAPLLAGRLVEPGLDIVLPVLLEVPIGDDVVVLMCSFCSFDLM